MTRLSTLRRFLKDDSGTTLVELAIVLPVFLLLFFGTIDIGRLGSEYVMSGKAMQIAARMAAVRPAACAGVPNLNSRGVVAPGTVPPRYGASCSSGANVCANPGLIACAGSTANPTANEIWTAVSPILPANATPANLRFVYSYDANLGFLGGPYVPVVTVELQNLSFQFVTPLGGLAALARAPTAGPPAQSIPFPSMSVSLPGEDLALGEAG
ncbi:MAG: TadE/TadG family type IV pilus assembly protein [Paracoccaceae bacterium]